MNFSIKRALALLLAATTILSACALTSCANSETPDTTPTSTPTSTPTQSPAHQTDLLARTEDGKALVYRVTRNDFADQTEISTVLTLKHALEAVSGCNVSIANDFDDKKNNADILEIVVGTETLRSYTHTLNADPNSWDIFWEGNKLFVLGKNIGALTDAVTAFCEALGYTDADHYTARTEWLLAEDYTQTGVWLNPEYVPDDGNAKVLYGLSQRQADAFFAEILDGLFEGTTTEIVDNDLVIGKDFNMHFPDMLYIDGEYWAYYICYRSNTGKGGVGLAKSTDGVNFKDCGCVIQPDQDYDCNGAYFAGVWLDDDGIFHLVYECKGGEGTEYGTLENVAYAISDDGVHWDKQGVLMYKNTDWGWQAANIGTPDLYKDGDTWYVFFHGYDYGTCQIGLAYGEDMSDLTMLPSPILPTEKGTLYSGTTGRRDIIYVGGWYYMVYEISTEQTPGKGFGNAYWTHQFARSRDLIEWEIVDAPLVRQTDANGDFKTGMGYDGPCWCIIGKHIYVYFRAGGGTMRAELLLNEQ